MAKKKSKALDEPSKTLTSKEVLQGFIQTLSERQCKEAFQFLREKYDRSKVRMVRLNVNGEEDDMGLVRLRPKELEKLLLADGEYKFYWKVKKLHTYLEDLKARAEVEAGEARQRWKTYEKISHYYRLSKGWVEECFKTEAHPPARPTETIDFYSIANIDEARRYLDTIPKTLWHNNAEVEWIIMKYPTLKEEIIHSND